MISLPMSPTRLDRNVNGKRWKTTNCFVRSFPVGWFVACLCWTCLTNGIITLHGDTVWIDEHNGYCELQTPIWFLLIAWMAIPLSNVGIFRTQVPDVGRPTRHLLTIRTPNEKKRRYPTEQHRIYKESFGTFTCLITEWNCRCQPPVSSIKWWWQLFLMLVNLNLPSSTNHN